LAYQHIVSVTWNKHTRGSMKAPHYSIKIVPGHGKVLEKYATRIKA